MERGLVTRDGIEFETIQGAAVVGVGALGSVIGLIKLTLGTMQAFVIVNRFKPEALYVTGGFTAIPVTPLPRLMVATTSVLALVWQSTQLS
jgi:UDP-N-acetylglucosamine:LPS N-acetylglucosamine transferase